MFGSKMRDVKGPVRSASRGASRVERPANAVQARDRRLPSPQGVGRAWINGREVGGENRRYAHLQPSYD